jgi:hypothetical protein
MNEMNEKKLYIWNLARFLHSYGMTMSAAELADHLNRNSFLTSYGTEYKGKRGTYRLIRAAWSWVHDDLGLGDEAVCVARAFVDDAGKYAYEHKLAIEK